MGLAPKVFDGTEDSPEINLCLHGQLIYDKGGKNMQRGKDSFFNKCVGKTGQPHVKD